MAACCIGGVCIPYSAILPLLALALKWLAVKLASLGILPDSVVQKFGLQATKEASCCGGCDPNPAETKSLSTCSSSTSDQVIVIESHEQWNSLFPTNSAVVVKFTATWCRPCREISPFFAELSNRFDAAFCEVDVDELDDIAAHYKVAMMPTFLILDKSKTEVVGCRGANQGRLEQMLEQYLK